jgi:hypothetical protein
VKFAVSSIFRVCSILTVVALLHGGFERRDGAVVESVTQRVGNQLARVYAFG